MQAANQEGTFNATIMEFGLKEMDSGSIAIAIRATLNEAWDGTEWQPWDQYEVEAEGDVWVVKKDGTINQGAAESLMKYAGWDGNLESITDGSWQPTKCSVTIKHEEYKGVHRYKIAFVNEWGKVPGALSNVKPEKAKELQSRFGSQLRALHGNVSRNSAPSVGIPPTPPAPPNGTAKTPPAPPMTPATAHQQTEEKLPF